MRAPAAAVTFAFAGGIAAGGRLPVSALVFFATLLLWSAIVSCRTGRRLTATALLLLSYFSLGAASRQLAGQAVGHQPLLRLYQSLGPARFEQPCLLTGILLDEPLATATTVRMRLGVEAIRLENATRVVTGIVRVNVRGDSEWRRSLTDLDAGDRVSLWARLNRPRGYLNPGSFDTEAYLARRGVTLSGSVKSPLLVERLSSSGWWSVARKASQARRFVRRRLWEAFRDFETPRVLRALSSGSEVPGVAMALLIGDRTWIPSWAERLYQDSGVFHVIVISGAHVALLAALVYGALRWMGLGRTPTLWGLVLVLPLYAELCGGRPAVVRAVTMCVCVAGARLLSLDSPAVNGLACSALLLLAARPLDLDDPGFQLSFAATAVILACVRPLARALAGRRNLTDGGSPGHLAHMLAISLLAQAAVVPLVAWHFQRLTLGATLASLVAMPLAAGSLVTSALVLALAPVPWLGEALTWVAGLLISALTACSRITIGVPGASIRVTQPAWPWLLMYAAVLVTLCLCRGRACRVAGVLAVVAVLWLPFQPAPSKSNLLRLVVLDVGHGDSLLLELPQGRRILVDAGGSFDRAFDMGERVVVPALLHRGVRRLRAVVLTHADFDHLGGLAAVVTNLDVGEIWEGRPAWSLPAYRALRSKAQARGVAFRRLRAGQAIGIDGARIEVLAAGVSSRYGNESRNNDSLVLRICYASSCLLLTGDAEWSLERELIRSGRSLRADVLKVAHHGSRSSTSAAFLAAVRPRVALVSTGAGNRYLPSARVMHRLRAQGVTSLRTDLDGAITVGLDGDGGIRIETFRNPG